MAREFKFERKFGVEIETFNNNGITRNTLKVALAAKGIKASVIGYSDRAPAGYWGLSSDGSIQGSNPVELVSPVLQGLEGLAELKKVCEVLDELKYQVNQSTGVHVHQDGGDLEWKQVQNLYKLTIGFEQTIFKMLPQSRRGAYYCREANPSNFNKMVNAKNANQLMNAWYENSPIPSRSHNSRYHGLNLNSWWYRGTVEFRYFNGTIEYDKLQAWIVLTSKMVDFAKEARSIKFEKQISPKSIKSTSNLDQARLYTLLDYINLTGWEKMVQDVRTRLFERLDKFSGKQMAYYYSSSQSHRELHYRQMLVSSTVA